jgi:hypothetical protein
MTFHNLLTPNQRQPDIDLGTHAHDASVVSCQQRIQSHGAAIICGGKGRAGSERNGPEAAQKGKQKKKACATARESNSNPHLPRPALFSCSIPFHSIPFPPGNRRLLCLLAWFVYLPSSRPAAAAEAGEGDTRRALDVGQGAPPAEIHQYVHTLFSLVAYRVDDPFVSIVDRVQVVKECPSVWLQSWRILYSF